MMARRVPARAPRRHGCARRVPKISTGDMLREAVPTEPARPRGEGRHGAGRAGRATTDDRDRAGAAWAAGRAERLRARRVSADGRAGAARSTRCSRARGPLVIVDVEVPEQELVRRLRGALASAARLRRRRAELAGERGKCRRSGRCRKCGGQLVQRERRQRGGDSRAAEGLQRARRRRWSIITGTARPSA